MQDIILICSLFLPIPYLLQTSLTEDLELIGSAIKEEKHLHQKESGRETDGGGGGGGGGSNKRNSKLVRGGKVLLIMPA